MAEDARRHVLRATFDRGAEGYDDARPVAPPEVFDDLVELARLGPGARLLEIGCGTGQATLPLAERGFSILAVELGANLAEVARRKLAEYPEVEIVTSSFEHWDPSGELFDAVVSFNAFHWIDPDVRFSKPAAVLQARRLARGVRLGLRRPRRGGPDWLAAVRGREAVYGWLRAAAMSGTCDDRSDDFTEDGHFATVTRKTYFRDLTYCGRGVRRAGRNDVGASRARGRVCARSCSSA